MSETLNQSSPELSSDNQLERVEKHKSDPETKHLAAETKQIDTEKVRHQVETEAVSGKELSTSELKPGKVTHESHLSPSELKKHAYKQTMSKVQSRLKGPSKLASKFIHQPIVDKVSNVASQTVFRPYSLVVGGLTALIGSSLMLYAARHYGFSYNYLVILLLFVAGWLLGMLLESLSRLFGRRH